MRQTGSGGGLSSRTFAARSGAIFARFAGSGFAAVRVRPARAAESGVGAGREFPECPGKGRGKTIAPSATGKAFFRPPVRIRRVRGNAARWPRPRAATGGGGFGAGNDIAAVRRSGAGDIFRYQLLSENIRARIPRMPWQGRRASSPAQRDRESVLPPARPHSADSGEFKADGLARRARQPVSNSYCTARRALTEATKNPR